MISFRIKIETLSATAPGSGEGRAGVIDRDITFTEQGLPYIGARRLKGLLREAACEVIEVLHTFDHWREQNLLTPAELFGTDGQSEAGPLRLDSARLENHEDLVAWLDYACTLQDGAHYFHAESVLDIYTELRSQTSMDRETGGPSKNTLRVTRLLRPDIVLYAEGTLRSPSTEWQEKALRTLALACNCLQRVGLSRNRGAGRIKAILECQYWKAYPDVASFVLALHGEQIVATVPTGNIDPASQIVEE